MEAQTDFEKDVLSSGISDINIGSPTAWSAFKVSALSNLSRKKGFPYRSSNANLYGDISLDTFMDTLETLPGRLVGAHTNSDDETEYIYILDETAIDKSIIYTIGFWQHRNEIEDIRFSFYGTNESLKEILDIFRNPPLDMRDQEEEEGKAGVWFGSFDKEGYVQTTHKQFPPLLLADIEQNYIPEVMEQVRELVDLLKLATNGIVIIRGPVGTGKTHLIRALISEMSKKRDAVVCTPPLAFLQNPMGLYQAMQNRENPLIIFEDLGELFREDAKAIYADHFSNLANMTDGLLSILDSSIYLLTFNYDIKDIDPAMIRGGRCIMDIVVPRLPMEQAKKLLPKGTELPDAENLSLAEIFNLKGGKVAQIKEKGTLGFKRQNSAASSRGYRY